MRLEENARRLFFFGGPQIGFWKSIQIGYLSGHLTHGPIEGPGSSLLAQPDRPTRAKASFTFSSLPEGAGQAQLAQGYHTPYQL